MTFSALAVEVVANILLKLPYEDLLVAERVCKAWNTVVGADPISRSSFQKPPRPLCPVSNARERTFSTKKNVWPSTSMESKDVRIHPAINRASYTFGSGLDAAQFFINGGAVQISTLAVANHYMTVPKTTRASFDASGIEVGVENPDGIRVIDFFQALVDATSLEHIKDGEFIGLIDDDSVLALSPEGGNFDFGSDTEDEYELLPGDVYDHPFYEGVGYVRLIHGVVTGDIYSGS
ncbi:hypothetical protein BKA62DRAFT_673827 [Auriculariales sp. MPI-PUGE-AT-0066]|nr:hypothetical protein BKA62DRAFT_673827 [Auriculariales sp. MPI-PUGE-AT-0066]